MIRFGVLILAVSLLLPLQAGAGTPPAPFPDDVQGIWSLPDCAAAQSLLVLSKSHVLDMRAGVYTLFPVLDWRRETIDGEPLYFFRTTNETGFLFKVTNDGLIRLAESLVHPKQPLGSAWGTSQEVLAKEYSHCAKLFAVSPSLSQDEVNLPFLLDQVIDSCGAVKPDDFAGAANCHAALFSVADSDKNHALDGTELGRFYRQANFLASRKGGGCGVAEKKPWPGDIAADSQNFAARMMTLLDSGKDGLLQEDEIESGLVSPLFDPAEREALLSLLRQSRPTLPFLPLSEAEKTCTAASGGGEEEIFTGFVRLGGKAPSPLSLDSAPGGCGCGQ